MVIYCTYDNDNSTLVSRHRYVVAQNNNLSDTINIKCVGMTDPKQYGYYIDFVCMTHGGAAKAAYSSPALEYGDDGLNFEVPNCLTQYEGYVDAQLVIYLKSKESVVAKSVGRTGGIFEVAASVNSLETRVIEPANMLTELSAAVLTADNLNTEVARTVEEARVVKADIENTLTSLDARLSEVVMEKMKEVVQTLPMSTVEFWFYDRLAASFTVVQGKTVPEFEYDFPNKCVCDGWYDLEKGRHWDFANDVAGDKNIRLYADCHNTAFSSLDENDVLLVQSLYTEPLYIPFTIQGRQVKTVQIEGGTQLNLTVYVNDFDYNFVNMAANKYIVSFANTRYYGGSSLVSTDGLLKGAHIRKNGVLEIDLTRAENIGFTFSQCLFVNEIVVKGDVSSALDKLATGNYLTYSLIIHDNVVTDRNLGNFFNLQSVILLSDTPKLMQKVTVSSRNENCKIYVPSQYLEIYRSNGWEDSELCPLEEYAGYDYSQTIYPTPEEFV